ncbi:hypothetical protein Leryth_016924 [Lithospermum erythrorhizon]|nr:hypothetical protein Leryth_016924 [Lithospermum erythrorhizon]
MFGNSTNNVTLKVPTSQYKWTLLYNKLEQLFLCLELTKCNIGVDFP